MHLGELQSHLLRDLRRDLLVGNFGDGTINAYDAGTFALKGQLQDTTGKPITNDRLGGRFFGQNGTGDPNTLYFSAGIKR